MQGQGKDRMRVTTRKDGKQIVEPVQSRKSVSQHIKDRKNPKRKWRAATKAQRP